MSIRTTEKLSTHSSITESGNGIVSVDSAATANAFKEILADKIDSIKDDTKRMQELRQEIQSLKDDRQITDIIRRIMPDGSVMITEYKDGEIVSRYRKKPHMIAVPDENAPVKLGTDGTPLLAQQTMVMRPSRSIASELFY